MNEIVTSVLASLGLGGLALWLARNWLIERLRQSIRHEYDTKLEVLKAQLAGEHADALEKLRAGVARDAAVLAVAHKSLSESQALAHQHRVEGVSELWRALLHVRGNAPAILQFLDILLPHEYPTIIDHPSFRSLVDGLSPEKIALMAGDFTKAVERTRLFVGEYLWSLFFAYQAISLRIAFLAWNSRNKGKVDPWFEDPATLGLLAAVATADETAHFKQLQFGQIAWLRRLIEGKFLTTANKIITGEASNDFAVQEALRISRAAETLSGGRESNSTLNADARPPGPRSG